MIAIDVKRRLKGADGELILQINTIINKGELVTIYGPTGSGKSSILRMLAGLMEPHEGIITVDEQTWYKTNNVNIKPQERTIGMVFQDYSLFPNMTVRGNLEYALEKNQDTGIIDELMMAAELEKLQHQRPSLLSGGQKQRLSLVRALVRKPKILLLDEPLSALDTQMRTKLQDYILQFHQQFNLTTILVSHDLPEVLKMSKRILVLENGLIKFDGSPHDMLKR